MPRRKVLVKLSHGALIIFSNEWIVINAFLLE